MKKVESDSTDISEGYADDVAEDYGDERQYRK